jgi:hypothetical protein
MATSFVPVEMGDSSVLSSNLFRKVYLTTSLSLEIMER